MNIISICGAAICAVLMILVIKEVRKDHAYLLSLAVGLLFFGFILFQLSDTVDYIRYLADTNSNREYVSTLMKALGIAYITEITREICKSCGETAVSGYVEAVGKTEIIVLCIPMIKELTITALKYI